MIHHTLLALFTALLISCSGQEAPAPGPSRPAGGQTSADIVQEPASGQSEPGKPAASLVETAQSRVQQLGHNRYLEELVYVKCPDGSDRVVTLANGQTMVCQNAKVVCPGPRVCPVKYERPNGYTFPILIQHDADQGWISINEAGQIELVNVGSSRPPIDFYFWQAVAGTNQEEMEVRITCKEGMDRPIGFPQHTWRIYNCVEPTMVCPTGRTCVVKVTSKDYIDAHGILHQAPSAFLTLGSRNKIYSITLPETAVSLKLISISKPSKPPATE